MLQARPNQPLVTYNSSDKPQGLFPPSGVIPGQSFTMMLAPFAYISDVKEEVYFIFRAFYCKYFCHLHSISSHPQGIISLCKLFEDLLQMYEPEVCYHLNLLNINPLKIVFNWLYFCYVGTLEID